MITEVEDYFAKGCGRCARFDTPDCSTRAWLPGLLILRRICREAGLTEAAKWGHPCYMHAGRNLAIIGAFRGDFRLTFFNAALLSDPDGLLEKQGENTRHPDCIRLTDTAAPSGMQQHIKGFLAQAIAHAEAGTLPPKEPAEIDLRAELPAELVEALDADPELAEAFAALTRAAARAGPCRSAAPRPPPRGWRGWKRPGPLSLPARARWSVRRGPVRSRSGNPVQARPAAGR